MKHILLTQARNESIRLKNWIAYHASQGIDEIYFFDDYSTDNTESNIKKICEQYNIYLVYNKTDGFGEIFDTVNSEIYGHSASLNHRIIRSLSSGLDQISKKYNNKAICYCLDVDEYLVTDSTNNISNIVEEIFISYPINRIYCHSFDVLSSYTLTECITNQESSCYRWDFESRRKSIFRERGKSIVISDTVQLPLPLKGNVVHDLGIKINSLENYYQFDNLRLHHFRNPNLIDNNYKIMFCYDDNLFRKTQNLL